MIKSHKYVDAMISAGISKPKAEKAYGYYRDSYIKGNPDTVELTEDHVASSLLISGFHFDLTDEGFDFWWNTFNAIK